MWRWKEDRYEGRQSCHRESKMNTCYWDFPHTLSAVIFLEAVIFSFVGLEISIIFSTPHCYDAACSKVFDVASTNPAQIFLVLSP